MSDQAAFTAALMDGAAPVPPGITGPDGTVSAKRFNVYRNNVIVSLIDAMGQAFPVVKKLVGDQFFDAMAGVFVRAHPPSSPVMMFYGDAFPAFVATFPPAASLPYLSDVAALEQARREAYHAADDPILSAEALGQIAPDALAQARLIPHASLRIIRSDHPIVGIWEANMGGEAPNQQPEIAVIARPQDEVIMMRAPSGAAHFLEELIAGTDLEGAAAKAASEDAEFDLSQTLGLALSAQLLCRIET